MKKGIILIGCVAAFIASSEAAIVINEIYGGGGNANAVFRNDFIELFNNSATETVTIGGTFLQYATESGTFGDLNTASPANTLTITAGAMLSPQQHYLIQAGSGGSVGSALGGSDQTLGTNLNATAGKLRLVAADKTTVIDLVGYGTAASQFEGAGRAPSGSNTQSISRVNGVDSNNNNLDFVAGAPSPVPEPSAAIALLSGASILLGRRRRRA
jgi:hypothetical protein